MFFGPFLRLCSQDGIYSQLSSSPVYVNPALTGIFDGQYRLGGAYRNQWFKVAPGSSFSDINLFFDTKFNISGDNYFGLGIDISNSNSGLAKISTATGGLSLSYMQRLSYDKFTSTSRFLVFGAQALYGIIYSDISGYSFGNQFDKQNLVFDPNIDSGENILSSASLMDLGAGILYFSSNNSGSFYIGLSMFHINKPIYSLISGSSDKLNSRFTFLIGGEKKINKDLSLLPALTINYQNHFKRIMAGSNIRILYSNSSENYLRFGAWTTILNYGSGIEFADFILNTTLNFTSLEIGFSYDINIGKNSIVAGGNGAFELNFKYIFGNTPKKYKIICPRL